MQALFVGAGELDKRFAYFFSGIVEAAQSGESTNFKE